MSSKPSRGKTILHWDKPMSSLKKQARRAGLLYFIGGVIAPFGLLYVPTTLIEVGNATATADNIRASTNLLRMGIAAEIAVAVIFLFVALALYHLFKNVNQTHALAMAALIIVSLPLSLMAAVLNFGALHVVSGEEWLSTFSQPQLDSLAYVFLRVRSETINVASVFWGLWLVPMGVLVWRSGFIPRLIGAGLWIAGAGYLIEVTTHVLLPNVNELLGPVFTGMAMFELPIMFWLLIWGARERKVVEASA